jgi:hypothetical protein
VLGVIEVQRVLPPMQVFGPQAEAIGLRHECQDLARNNHRTLVRALVLSGVRYGSGTASGGHLGNARIESGSRHSTMRS